MSHRRASFALPADLVIATNHSVASMPGSLVHRFANTVSYFEETAPDPAEGTPVGAQIGSRDRGPLGRDHRRKISGGNLMNSRRDGFSLGIGKSLATTQELFPTTACHGSDLVDPQLPGWDLGAAAIESRFPSSQGLVPYATRGPADPRSHLTG